MSWITSSSWDLRLLSFVCSWACDSVDWPTCLFVANIFVWSIFIAVTATAVAGAAAGAVTAIAEFCISLYFRVNVSSSFYGKLSEIFPSRWYFFTYYFLNINSLKVDHVSSQAMKTALVFAKQTMEIIGKTWLLHATDGGGNFFLINFYKIFESNSQRERERKKMLKKNYKLDFNFFIESN